MASLKMSIPHQLTQQEALNRIKHLLAKLQQEQKDKISNVKEDWNGETGNFQFTAKGFDLSGVIKVQPSSIDIDATVPFAVSLFKEQIK
jgi:hypothetical protein